jgi:hypothetical protein
MQRVVPALAAALVAAFVLSGCSSVGNDVSSNLENAARSIDVQGSETTGVIRGIVVDTGIHPLAQATVTVKVGATTLSNKTNADGAFGFGKVAPGTYFLDVKKSGFKSTQQSVEVKANDNNPPIVKVLLEADASAQKPSHDTFHFRGFIECSVLAGFPSAGLGGGGLFQGCYVPSFGPTPEVRVGNENSFTNFQFSGNVSWVHTTMAWTPTQAFGAELYFNTCWAIPPDNYPSSCLAYTGGASPISADVKGPSKDTKAFETSGTVYFETSTYGVGDPSGAYGGTMGGASLEQPFDAYLVVFHGYTPPAGYTFAKDGEPKDPK